MRIEPSFHSTSGASPASANGADSTESARVCAATYSLKFASEAAKAGLKNLKGHRSVGGMRASIYNAMPKEGVEALVAFIKLHI